MSVDALRFEQVKGELNLDGGGLLAFWHEPNTRKLYVVAISFGDLARFGMVDP